MISAVEFYSGIGGLHLALSRCLLPQPVQILASYDWDQTACRVYTHNFPSTTCHRTDISLLAPDDIPVADLWLLSPACQPYTILNPNAKGADDPRAKSFLHLIQRVLPQMIEARRPDYMLVENVAGFEVCPMHIAYNTEELKLVQGRVQPRVRRCVTPYPCWGIIRTSLCFRPHNLASQTRDEDIICLPGDSHSAINVFLHQFRRRE